jgi:RES domain-containing protein
MRLKAHKRYRDLKKWCAAQRSNASPVAGTFFRVAGPRHTSAAAIVSGVGGYKANGRWCRRGVTNLLYLSVAPETAMHESNAWARRHSLPLWSQMPKVTVAIEVEAEKLLDLTSAPVVSTLPVAINLLMDED